MEKMDKRIADIKAIILDHCNAAMRLEMMGHGLMKGPRIKGIEYWTNILATEVRARFLKLPAESQVTTLAAIQSKAKAYAQSNH